MFVNITKSTFFDEAMALYGETFPINIREPEQVFLNSMSLSDERYHFVGMVIADKLVGFITFHLEKQYHIGFIIYLVVHPDYRGRNIAAKLMNYAEERMSSIDTDLESIMLECEQDENRNSPLEPFYKKFDYHKYPIYYMQPGLRDDQPVPMNLFVKTIKDSRQRFLAITQIYTAKYHEANGISLTKLQDYISTM
ncbi:GNAT family N-acetyltransferase [Macrococcus lamae]|uniref:GNAT family N-acetyltransferase n=1 Tax=Macrococcus lamae TaxID=198484 RepID=A0A4R6BU99_9STAP|nr:GNAT family N-acetyltransferase [Macrococcus lamae]TDM10439.1 GNAT family N-acetyltransferase [Macrococcus lamae]